MTMNRNQDESNNSNSGQILRGNCGVKVEKREMEVQTLPVKVCLAVEGKNEGR